MSKINEYYSSAKAAESVVFKVSPLPLAAVKSGVQNVAVPLAIGTMATHAPLVGPLASTAIRFGSEAVQAGTHNLLLEGLNQAGSMMAAKLPVGLGIQTSYDWLSSAGSEVLLAANDMAMHTAGAIGTTLMLGKSMANSAAVTFNELRPKTLNEVIASAQLTYARASLFVERVKYGVNELRTQAETFIQKEFAKLSQDNQNPKTVLATDPTQIESNGTQPNPNGQVPQTVLASDPTQIESNGTQPQINYQATEAPSNRPKETVNAALKAEPLVSQASPDAEDWVRSNIVDVLARANIDVNRLYINMDGETIYRFNNDRPDVGNTITEAQQKLIEQALQDPAAFGGDLKIKIGGQTVLNIEAGQIKLNSMGLAKESATVDLRSKEAVQQAAVPENPSSALWQKYGANVSNDMDGIKAATDAALKDGIEPKEVRSMLGQSAHFKQIAESKGETVAEKSIARTVTVAQKRVLQEQRPKQSHGQEQAHRHQQAQTIGPSL